MIRILRIALLTLIPTLALGVLASACSDDTTTVVTLDMTAIPHDMATHDLAQPVD